MDKYIILDYAITERQISYIKGALVITVKDLKDLSARRKPGEDWEGFSERIKA